MDVVYFSNVSENTHRFVQKLDTTCYRIPTAPGTALTVSAPYVLITPTYGAGRGDSVPKQVKRFLNDEANRELLQGVVGTGNTNFGDRYCRAADIVADRCNVSVLHRLELMGTPEDVVLVNLLTKKELVK